MMQARMVGRLMWTPRPLMKQQARFRKRYLFRAGGLTRRIAQRSLRKARKIRVSELPDEAREEYLEAMEDYRAGHRDKPPVLRTIISSPGDPPLLQTSPSPLKRGLRFSVDEAATTVAIGPERSKSGIAGDLEYGRGKVRQPRPFMRPALAEALPKLPGILARSAKGS